MSMEYFYRQAIQGATKSDNDGQGDTPLGIALHPQPVSATSSLLGSLRHRNNLVIAS
jgi:hypothetical protein